MRQVWNVKESSEFVMCLLIQVMLGFLYLSIIFSKGWSEAFVLLKKMGLVTPIMGTIFTKYLLKTFHLISPHFRLSPLIHLKKNAFCWLCFLSFFEKAPTKFLTGLQVLEGGYWESGGDFFQDGGGCNFSIKKLKSGIFNDKKVYKQEFFVLSELRIQTGKF